MISICTWNSNGPIKPKRPSKEKPDRGPILRAMNCDLLALQHCEEKPDLGMEVTTRHSTNYKSSAHFALGSRHTIRDIFPSPIGNGLGAIIEAPNPFFFASVWSIGKGGRGDDYYMEFLDCSARMMRFFRIKADAAGLPLIIAGDFNISMGHPIEKPENVAKRKAVFDGWKKEDHMASAYHLHNGVSFGKEVDQTIKGKSGSETGKAGVDKPYAYHIDYIFYDDRAFKTIECQLNHEMAGNHAAVCAKLAPI